MKYFFWTISITLFVVFLVLFWITFRPIKNVTAEDVVQVEGIVTDIYQGSGNDIYFKIKQVERPFYINRGMKLGLYLDSLNNTVLNKRVILHSIKRWTPLTTDGIHPHISKLVVDDKVIFNEIEDQ
ncbi:hypothetical protein [Spongiivirga citrea]|uniref:Uncharacterized protein n=1 Tax=Spongiivirga citrea TaxID=1481457 RepID=A0A6M0CHI0_9FLAO|nr:hypothetical protein [Spongiivirga citrea]NER16972.1 hypothetical protein [Spongiivirga citrea]